MLTHSNGDESSHYFNDEKKYRLFCTDLTVKKGYWAEEGED